MQPRLVAGFCKQQLWPLFHYLLPLSPNSMGRFNPELWQAYVKAYKASGCSLHSRWLSHRLCCASQDQCLRSLQYCLQLDLCVWDIAIIKLLHASLSVLQRQGMNQVLSDILVFAHELVISDDRNDEGCAVALPARTGPAILAGHLLNAGNPTECCPAGLCG